MMHNLILVEPKEADLHDAETAKTVLATSKKF